MMGLIISEGISQMEGQLSQKPEVALQKQLHTTVQTHILQSEIKIISRKCQN